MICLKLFLTFLKIGAVSLGGGYGMISLMRDDCLANGWLSEGELLDLIAVAESTPGPIAVNMATFVGSSQCGLLGAFLATLGVVLPSFVLILLVASVLTRLLKYGATQAVLGAVRPAVIALILGTAVTMLLRLLLGIERLGDGVAFDGRVVLILGAVSFLSWGYGKWKKQKISPILIVVLSGVMGALLYA